MAGSARLIPLVAVMLLGTGATAAAQNVWTALGNTGAVDETGRSIYVFNSAGSVAIAPSANNVTLEMRYNVTGVQLIGETATPADPDSDLESQNCIRLDAKLRDTGPGARVIVRVLELNDSAGPAGSGEMRILGTIDSDSFNLPSPEYINYSMCLPVPKEFQFNYAFRAYVVEAHLNKTQTSANPGLKLLRLCSRGAGTP